MDRPPVPNAAQPPEPETAEPTPVPVPVTGSDALPRVPELGGRDGPEPTRYGDWEVRGICVDF